MQQPQDYSTANTQFGCCCFHAAFKKKNKLKENIWKKKVGAVLLSRFDFGCQSCVPSSRPNGITISV
jgi:hypothetical protein